MLLRIWCGCIFHTGQSPLSAPLLCVNLPGVLHMLRLHLKDVCHWPGEIPRRDVFFSASVRMGSVVQLHKSNGDLKIPASLESGSAFLFELDL